MKKFKSIFEFENKQIANALSQVIAANLITNGNIINLKTTS